VALLCIYGIAARIGGRLFGYWAAALWIALPYFGILFVEPGYHQKYTELTIPHIVGLTAMSDFPSMVGLLVSAYFCLRALESGNPVTMGAAGLAAGYAIAVKPSSAIFLFGPALLLLIARWRTVVPFVAGIAPIILTLAFWKYRGLGHLGATQPEPIRLAGGVGDFLRRIHNPSANSWAHFHANLTAIREHFWVARVLEWLPVAGSIALLARSRRIFWLIVPWFAAFLAIKGSYEDARMDDASFFRILLPAFPAFVLLMAAIPLLLPGTRARAAALPATILRGRRVGAAAIAAFVVFAVFPVVVIAAARQIGDDSHMLDYAGTLVPVRDLGLQSSTSGNAVQLSWPEHHVRPAKTFYVVLRTNDPAGGVSCAHFVNASVDCSLSEQTSIPTRSTMLVDHPGQGTWTYRLGFSANWLDDVHLGDVYVMSPPISVTVP
jgi:4-amino-4-deoxy-L-arabinose transferase-like glycosyltransferase